MRVIGTAGHVDHGKSTLVAALTGIHPDRLKEEKEREMTIDLGFAWMDLPSGETVGIVDVPGHRDFIENMLAGVGGIDAVLFVIAADEGIMPQTREHLAIVDLLEIPGGVIALTKTDMIDDPEWLDLVEEEIRKSFAGTVLAPAPILRVSARKGIGLEPLKAALDQCLKERPPRVDRGRPRLPIDRVFSITGFGTVVTGTLLDGSFSTGDEVEILPGGIKTRIRGLQTHKQKESNALPGSRVAANITSVDTNQVRRGDTLARPSYYSSTRRVDAGIRLLQDASSPLAHDTEVKFFSGTTEVIGRVRVLGNEKILPGESGYIQLEFEDPVVVDKGDHYILRRPSPGETLGGGRVIDPHPRGRYKRFSPTELARLETLQKGTPAETLMHTLQQMKVANIAELAKGCSYTVSQAIALISSDELTGEIVVLKGTQETLNGDSVVTARSTWKALTDQAESVLSDYHRSFPLRAGMPREEFRARLKLTPAESQLFLPLWQKQGLIRDMGTTLAVVTHSIELNPEQKKAAVDLLRKFDQEPPSVKDCQQEVGAEVFSVLLAQGELVQLNPEVVILGKTYDDWLAMTRKTLQKDGKLTVAEFRDRAGTSRKFALAFLEALDAKGITRREGDYRVLVRVD